VIRYYLSNNNEMCYSTKIDNFSPTKQGLSRSKPALVIHPMSLFQKKKKFF